MVLVAGFGLLPFIQLLGILPFCRLWKGWLYWQFSTMHRYCHQKFIFALGPRVSWICVWCGEVRLNILQGIWNKNSRWWWGKPSSCEHDNGPLLSDTRKCVAWPLEWLSQIKPFICWGFFFYIGLWLQLLVSVTTTCMGRWLHYFMFESCAVKSNKVKCLMHVWCSPDTVHLIVKVPILSSLLPKLAEAFLFLSWVQLNGL
jgi:hypothetical protein